MSCEVTYRGILYNRVLVLIMGKPYTIYENCRGYPIFETWCLQLGCHIHTQRCVLHSDSGSHCFFQSCNFFYQNEKKICSAVKPTVSSDYVEEDDTNLIVGWYFLVEEDGYDVPHLVSDFVPLCVRTDGKVLLHLAEFVHSILELLHAIFRQTELSRILRELTNRRAHVLIGTSMGRETVSATVESTVWLILSSSMVIS